MPSRRELALLQRNTETVRLTILDEDTGTPQDLTGVTVEVYVKPSAETDDDDPSVTLLTAVAQSPASAGIATLTVPADVLAAAGESWWRVDCVAGDSRKTAMYGPFIVRDT